MCTHMTVSWCVVYATGYECVCVCVCEREREKESARECERERERKRVHAPARVIRVRLAYLLIRTLILLDQVSTF